MRTVVPGQRQFPGEVVRVPDALVEALGAERAQEVRGVPGEEDPSDAPAAGQPVVDRVDAGVQEFVRRCRAVGPPGQGLPDPGHQLLGRDQVLARRQQPVEAPHPVRQGTSGDLAGRGAGRAPWRCSMKQRLVGPGEFRTQCRDGVSFDRRTAREADVLELADRGAGAVTADQITATPPGALGAAGVGGHARGFLFDAVEAAVHGDPGQALAGQGGAQSAGQHVLGDVQGSGSGLALGVRGVRSALEDDLAHHLLAPHRPPSGPVDAGFGERYAGQPLDEGGGVLAQDDGARQARFVLARSFVEDHGGHFLTCQSEGEREPDGPRSDDDHRVHGAAPPARGGVPRDMGEQEGGAGCTITERMQQIAGACVK